MQKIAFTTFLIVWLSVGYTHAEQKETELAGSISYPETPEDHRHLRKFAREGNVGAQELLGFIYKRGEQGAEVDEVQAVYWFTRAAEQESVQAQAALGEIFLNRGSEDSIAEARVLLMQAAKQNHSLAQYHLGTIFLHGIGGTQDLVQAYVWFARSARGGNRHAEFIISVRGAEVLLEKMTAEQIAEAKRLLEL